MAPRTTRKWRFLAGLLAFLLPAANVTAGPATPATREDYRVQPGDTIEVHVWNESEQGREFVVDPLGNVSYPMVGVIPVKGMSIREITDRIVAELAKHFKNPRVTVSVKAIAPPSPAAAAASKRIFVFGAVAKPGAYDLFPGMRVIDALALAGGLSPKAAASQATLSGAERGKLPLDLDRLLVGGEIALNVPLNADDVLLVPALDEKATGLSLVMVGQVARPGSYRLPLGARLSDAMSVCGGATEVGDLRQVKLTRAGLTVTVDLETVLRKGDLASDLSLQDGDIVFIPEKTRQEISLLGEFQKPGIYEFRAGATILDALALAGGPSPEADLRGAVLKRGGKEIAVDLFALLKQGDLQANLTLAPGDVLVVPTGMRVYALGAVGKPGPLTISRDAKLIDVLFLAGGAAPQARLDKAGVVRIVNEKPEILPLNIKEATEQGGADRNFRFAAGDILFIPKKPQAYSWQSVIGTATSVAGALWLLGAIDRR